MEQYIGPQSVGVVAGLLLILGSGAKGLWLFRYQSDKELAAKDAIIAQLNEQLRQQREGSAQRLAEERADKLEWKEIALNLSGLASRATNIAEKSVR